MKLFQQGLQVGGVLQIGDQHPAVEKPAISSFQI